MEYLIISLFAFGSGFITSLFGFGAGLVLTPLLTFFMPIKEALAFGSFIFLFTSLSKTWFYRKEIHLPTIKQGLPLETGGMVLGFFLVGLTDSDNFTLLYGLLLLWFAVNALLDRQASPSPLPTWSFPVLGGLLSVLVHGGGMFFLRYARMAGLDRIASVATLAAIHFSINIFKTIFFAKMGLVSGAFLPILIPASAAAVAGAWLGRIVLKEWLTERQFSLGIAVILFLLAGKVLLYA